MTKIGLNKITLKVKGYVNGNWCSPFAVAFMLFLVGATFFLSGCLSYLANTVAVYVYYALIAGVFLQLARFPKYFGKINDGVLA